MMPVTRYDVVYRTSIHYDDIVRASQNELRACPASDDHQQVVAYRTTTHPASRVLTYQDYFGTRVDTFGVREPHVLLEISAEASVETFPRALVTVSPRVAELRSPSFRDRYAEYLGRTGHTAWDDDMAEAARRVAAISGDDVVGIVLALHRFAHTSLRYTPGATYIGVDVNEVLAKAQGVCQDYAHLAVALCRSIDIPARYVSGYFFAASESTGEEVDGDVVSVQTHAWFEAAIPGWGWLALDPTNALQVGPRHITIGHGRDYDDVPPIRGVYSGGGRPNTQAGVEIRRQTAVAQQLQAQQ
ncbi:MAG: transglutaminase family protein [Acidimicrobiales bacterium]|nr:transglutaminase family protein [Acidimicrobiales bacterium]